MKGESIQECMPEQNPDQNPGFLREKFSDLVPYITKKTAERAGKKRERVLSIERKDPLMMIQEFLDSLSAKVDYKKPKGREERIATFKAALHKKALITPERIPESYFNAQRRTARAQGFGDVTFSDAMRQEYAQTAVEEQRHSLDAWIDYLLAEDSLYPDWFIYYVLREVVGTGAYDMGKKAYAKRDRGSVAPFPEINSQALTMVLDQIVGGDLSIRNTSKQYNFRVMYAGILRELVPLDDKQLEEIEGEWRSFHKNSPVKELTKTLTGYNTGLCIAGDVVAQKYLSQGDLRVYYSHNDDSDAVIPRAAIWVVAGLIKEVRGIGFEQNLDRYIAPKVDAELDTFPNGTEYKKRSSDMRRMTEIEDHMKAGAALSAEDLRFLYEIDAPIEGFGRVKDPRVAELRALRVPALKEDVALILNVPRGRVACSMAEIDENTKVYVGTLDPGIFQKFSDTVEHIYTSFPNEKVRRFEFQFGGKTPEALQEEIRRSVYQTDPGTEFLLQSTVFSDTQYETPQPSVIQDAWSWITGKKPEKVLKSPEQGTFIRLTIESLGFPNGATTEQIFNRAIALGLELCSPEAAPHYCLRQSNQPMDESLIFGMKPIIGQGGCPNVFGLDCYTDGPGLYGYSAEPDFQWVVHSEFVFRLRKKS